MLKRISFETELIVKNYFQIFMISNFRAFESYAIGAFMQMPINEVTYGRSQYRSKKFAWGSGEGEKKV